MSTSSERHWHEAGPRWLSQKHPTDRPFAARRSASLCTYIPPQHLSSLLAQEDSHSDSSVSLRWTMPECRESIAAKVVGTDAAAVQISLKDCLMHGGFGSAYVASSPDIADNEEFVLKIESRRISATDSSPAAGGHFYSANALLNSLATRAVGLPREVLAYQIIEQHDMPLDLRPFTPRLLAVIQAPTIRDCDGLAALGLCLEFCGRNLAQMLKTTFSVVAHDRAVKYALDRGAQAVQSLARLHACGIIHCDIKLENFVMSSSRDCVHIIDFGCAKPAAASVVDIAPLRPCAAEQPPSSQSPQLPPVIPAGAAAAAAAEAAADTTRAAAAAQRASSLSEEDEDDDDDDCEEEVWFSSEWCGTPEYATVAALMGSPADPRDDLEPLAWALLEATLPAAAGGAPRAELPWRVRATRSSGNFDRRVAARLRADEEAAILLMPPALRSFAEYVRAVKVWRPPQYERAAALLRGEVFDGPESTAAAAASGAGAAAAAAGAQRKRKLSDDGAQEEE